MTNWYATADLAATHAGTLVMLQGHGRVYPGWLDLESGAARRWVAMTAEGDVVTVPRRIAPTLWQPLEPRDWRWPLPEPAAAGSITPRMVNIAAKPPLDPEAVAAPEHAIATIETGAADADWPFAYASAPYISQAEAEHRLLRALKTSRTPGVVKNIHQGVKSNWPVHDMVAGCGDYAAPITVRAFEPTRRDLGDWWLAVGWISALYPLRRRPRDYRPGDTNVEQRIVLWRSEDYSWRQIGEACKRSSEWARRRYGRCMDVITEVANETR